MIRYNDNRGPVAVDLTEALCHEIELIATGRTVPNP